MVSEVSISQRDSYSIKPVNNPGSVTGIQWQPGSN